MGRHYAWMSKREADAMHYVTFFAYYREAQLQLEAEQRAYDDAKNGRREWSDDEVAASQQTFASELPQVRMPDYYG